jgi:hypothetical protein
MADASRDPLNVELEDNHLLAEVQLLVELIVAAGESDRPLSQDEVDLLLGFR